MAKVKEIQICGGRITKWLSDACLDYVEEIAEGTDRQKLNFSILLDDGTTKHITFRQEDDGVEVYGDFEAMPNFLEYTQRAQENR